MMERREKQLLKNKLKRIKTHQTHEHSQKSKQDNHKQAQTPVVSSFDISPIKIKIP
jgi:F0F1-type ATP synthase assembly protein I